MARPIEGRERIQRSKFCCEISAEAQSIIRQVSHQTKLPQYEILERLVRNESAIENLLTSKPTICEPRLPTARSQNHKKVSPSIGDRHQLPDCKPKLTTAQSLQLGCKRCLQLCPVIIVIAADAFINPISAIVVKFQQDREPQKSTTTRFLEIQHTWDILTTIFYWSLLKPKKSQPPCGHAAVECKCNSLCLVSWVWAT